jgi:hypothetical protein
VGHPQQGARRGREAGAARGGGGDAACVRLGCAPRPRTCVRARSRSQESYLARQREIAEFKAWLATQPYDDEILGEQAETA